MMICITIWITALVQHAAAPVAMAQGTVEPTRFTFADVHRQAADLANRPYKKTKDILPQPVRDLSYDQYRDIRFRPEKALCGVKGCRSRCSSFNVRRLPSCPPLSTRW